MKNQTTESDQSHAIATSRYLNVSAIKKHALECSARLRAGKFNRVGESFITDVQAEVDRLLYHINGQYQNQTHPIVLPAPDAATFITGAIMARMKATLNDFVPRIIQAKVQQHPSLGKTLK